MNNLILSLMVFLFSVNSYGASLPEFSGLLSKCTEAGVRQSNGRLEADVTVARDGSGIFFNKTTYNARGVIMNVFYYELKNASLITGFYVAGNEIHAECSAKCVSSEITTYLDVGSRVSSRSTYSMPVAICAYEDQARSIASDMAIGLSKPLRFTE